MNKEDPTLTLTLPLSAINTAISGLLELPAKFSNPVITEITKQCDKQLKLKAEAVDE